MIKLVIAGASGFVGKRLIDAFRTDYSLIGLSRSPQSSPGAEWRACDLFSLRETEKALEGAEIGIYLVHSMLPSARLTQGSFQDFDLISADNFARAAKKAGLKQIIYLGGLIDQTADLSTHLKSRLEVEKVLNSYGVPVTTLRAGLIMGPGGSSFLVLKRLVERLPAMILPAWTDTRTQAIGVKDIIKLIRFCLGKEECFGQSYDVGTTEVITYRLMLKECAKQLNRHRLFLKVPVFSPKLSKAWVCLVTGAPYSLVGPLVDSLGHEMLLSENRLMESAKLPPKTFAENLREVLEEDQNKVESPFRRMRKIKKTNREASKVRSVQRMKLQKSMPAKRVVELYLQWLPRFLPYFIRVELREEGKVCRLQFRFPRILLLQLERDEQWSADDRQLLRIRGGLLAKKDPTGMGRLEFRIVLKGQYVLAAIHDFRPSLPWLLYSATQAKAHLWVMKHFSRYLYKKSAGEKGL
jgi:nucleoside-diphosphate-sugar epimerase